MNCDNFLVANSIPLELDWRKQLARCRLLIAARAQRSLTGQQAVIE